jgi:hypothetical protein
MAASDVPLPGTGPERDLGSGRARDRALPDRPQISDPAARPVPFPASGAWVARQPGLGVAGLLFVVPVAVLLAVGAGGAERSALVLGPLATFALPAIAMIAFWWEDWPGSSLRPGWSGLADTGLVAFAAVLLTLLGQSVVGRADLQGVFDPAPGPGHLPTFPATMPLAGAAFVAMLQLTLVCEGWPLRRLSRFTAGVAALAVAWLAAVAVYLVLVEVEAPSGSGLDAQTGPLTGAQLGALLVLIGVWQVWFFVTWRGWPFAVLPQRWQRLVAGNVVVLGGGLLTFAVAHDLAGVPTATLTAVGGCYIAAGLVIGMLFERWPRSRPAVAAAVLALTVALFVLLSAYAGTLDWDRATAEEWVAHVGLNALGISVVLHVAIGSRWPFPADPRVTERDPEVSFRV